jgi:hypothetical protein
VAHLVAFELVKDEQGCMRAKWIEHGADGVFRRFDVALGDILGVTVAEDECAKLWFLEGARLGYAAGRFSVIRARG